MWWDERERIMRSGLGIAAMRKLASLIALALWAMPAIAGGGHEVWVPLHHDIPDTLRPGGDGDEPKDYRAINATVFRELYAPDVRARKFEYSPFSGGLGGSGEGGMAIRLRDGRYAVTAAYDTKWLWPYSEAGKELAAELKERPLDPADYRDVPVKRCSIAIDAKLGDRLVALWQAMIAKASYHYFGTPAQDDDPVYFAAVANRGVVEASAYWSIAGRRVRTFLSMANALQDYCMTRKHSALKDVVQSVDLLTAMLAEKTPP